MCGSNKFLEMFIVLNCRFLRKCENAFLAPNNANIASIQSKYLAGSISRIKEYFKMPGSVWYKRPTGTLVVSSGVKMRKIIRQLDNEWHCDIDERRSLFEFLVINSANINCVKYVNICETNSWGDTLQPSILNRKLLLLWKPWIAFLFF